jgi:hypothetical protein
MEGEEREAPVIDGVVLRMSCVSRTSMSYMRLKVRQSPGHVYWCASLHYLLALEPSGTT